MRAQLRMRLFVVGLAALGAGVLAVSTYLGERYLFSEQTLNPPASAGALACHHSHWHVGRINVTNGIVLVHDFALHNTSAASVAIGPIATSCGCVMITPPPSVLGPFDTCHLETRLSIAPSTALIDQHIDVPLENSKEHLTLRIEGEGFVGPAVLCFPRTVSFGDLSPGETVRRTIHLTSNNGQAVHIGAITTSNPGAMAYRSGDETSFELQLSNIKNPIQPETLTGIVTITAAEKEFGPVQVPFNASLRSADARLVGAIVVGKLENGVKASYSLTHAEAPPVQLDSVSYIGDGALRVASDAPKGHILNIASAITSVGPRRAAGLLGVKLRDTKAVSWIPISAVCCPR